MRGWEKLPVAAELVSGTKGVCCRIQVGALSDPNLERRATPRTPGGKARLAGYFADDVWMTFCAPAATQPVPPSAQTTR